jgi:hypothetical protein
MRILSPMLAMLTAVVMLAGNAGVIDEKAPNVVAAMRPSATPAATTEAQAKDGAANAASRRRAMLVLFLSANGHPFGFFK